MQQNITNTKVQFNVRYSVKIFATQMYLHMIVLTKINWKINEIDGELILNTGPKMQFNDF